MPRIYLHCGLPKTGTTSIQMLLAQSRAELRTHKFEYPELGMSAERTAHHNFARELQGSPSFSGAMGTIGEFLDYMDRQQPDISVILSSEGFSNCLFDSDANRKFMGFIRALMDRNNIVQPVFTFRKFSAFFESNYLYKIKAGGIGNNPVKLANAAMAARWLRNLFKGLTSMRELVGEDAMMVCDVGEGEDSVKEFLALLDLPFGFTTSLPPRRNKRLGLKKMAFLYQLQYSLGRVREERWSFKEMGRISKRIEKAPELENEIFHYHVISFDEANLIQETARELMPGFLADRLRTTTVLEKTPYEAVDLAKVGLTRDEVALLRAAMPPDLRDRAKNI